MEAPLAGKPEPTPSVVVGCEAGRPLALAVRAALSVRAVGALSVRAVM